VLEIGAGTGYNAALIARLVEPGGTVVSVDIDADLVERAASGLRRAGYPGVTVIRADGGLGVPDRAPFDRIIATVGVWDLAPAWLEQLAPGGRLVVPLDLGGVQCSVAFERSGGHWTSRSVVACGFMRLRGAFAGPEQIHVLDREAQLTLMMPLGGKPDRTSIVSALLSPPVERLPASGARPADMFGGLGLWLAAHEPRWCLFNETGTGEPILPQTPVRIQDQRLTAGVVARDGAALLAADPEHGTVALGYGVGGSRLAGDLVEHVQAWDRAGRPGVEGMRVDAYPSSTSDSPGNGDGRAVGTAAGAGEPGAVALEKTHTRIMLSWPAAGTG
jgi:protein-L-isoaspartate(D-aspartate) O-methyltransferase